MEIQVYPVSFKSKRVLADPRVMVFDVVLPEAEELRYLLRSAKTSVNGIIQSIITKEYRRGIRFKFRRPFTNYYGVPASQVVLTFPHAIEDTQEVVGELIKTELSRRLIALSKRYPK